MPEDRLLSVPGVEAAPVRFPRWGADVVGTPGGHAIHRLLVNGDVVSTCYSVVREGVAYDGVDSWTVRVLGIGGVKTALRHRRRGHATSLLDRVVLAHRAGFDLAALFSLTNRVPHYEARGWVMVSDATYRQPDREWPVALPEDVSLGVRALKPGRWVAGASLRIEGLPW